MIKNIKNKINDFLVVRDKDFSFIKNIKLFIQKNREICAYIIIGMMTTFISLFLYCLFVFIFDNFIKISIPSWQIAESISFVVAVAFSFTCDKFIVFESAYSSFKKLIVEIIQFLSSRLIVESIAAFIMHFLIDINHMNAYFSKVLVMVLIIVLNYITSKFIIFRKH